MSISVLAVNIGSTSIKLGAFQVTSDDVGSTACAQAEVSGPDPSQPALLQAALTRLRECGTWPPPDYIVHRMVHGGDITQPISVVTAELQAELESLARFAPLHQPAALSAIRWLTQKFPQARHHVCFDTVFHASGRGVHDRYAIPATFARRGIRRYGFHGLAIEDALWQLQAAGYPVDGRLIFCHLGGGSSVSAVRGGRSVASTMGTTPLDGVVMGTRCGQLDPGALLAMLEMGETPGKPLSFQRATEILYRESGLRALSGGSGDLRDLINDRSTAATEAVEYYICEVIKAIGAMAAVLQGVDLLVFSGGVAEHQHELRSKIIGRLAWLGLKLSETPLSRGAANGMISILTAGDSQVLAVKVLIEEQRAMVRKLTGQLDMAGHNEVA